MDKHLFNPFLIICVALVLIAGLLAVNFYIKPPQAPNVPQSITQTFAEIVPGPKTTTILAPDGKMTLIAREESSKDGVTETFSTQTGSGGTIQIYSETLGSGSSISIPYNTFSPDNKYVFLKKTTPSGVSYFVLKTDGTPISKDAQIIDFSTLFNQKYPDEHAITDATGWGGVDLIVVNTDKPAGVVSHSFWYDVASNSFIQLSTRFN